MISTKASNTREFVQVRRRCRLLSNRRNLTGAVNSISSNGEKVTVTCLVVFVLLMQQSLLVCESFSSFSPTTRDRSHLPFQRLISKVRGGSSTGNKSSTTNLDASTNDDSKIDSFYDVVIVGGGPSGLATALMLSGAPHNCKCLLLESNKLVDTYDPTKAFLYNVNARGLRLVKQYPNLYNKLKDQGVESQALVRNFSLVPGSPDDPLPPKIFDIERRCYPPPGSTEQEDKNTASSSSTTTPIPNESYWIPRHDFTNILKEEVESLTSTTICMGMSCRAILPSTSGSDKRSSAIEVIMEDTETGENLTSVKCKLVVGADGYKSFVRDCMSHSQLIEDVDTGNAYSTGRHNFQQHVDWETSPKHKFKVKKYKSPATGLRIKVLQLPPQFEIPYLTENPNVDVSEGEEPSKIVQFVKTHGSAVYAIRSIYTEPTTYTSLGALPVKDNNVVRPMNLITRSNHVAWTITTGKEMKEWFVEAFPRFFKLSPSYGDSLVSDDEWERFAKAEGTRFPHCQYTNGISLKSLDGHSGLTLVGDAIHSYPPDIGQGVNSGLLDVLKLSDMLKDVPLSSSSSSLENTTNTKTMSLGKALTNYEKDRLPESKALIRLARFGAPYQYRQPLKIDKFGRRLHSINLVVRTLLHKVTFGLTPEPAIILARSHPNLTFRQVMRRADCMTFVLGTFASWILKRLVLATIAITVKK